MSFCPSPWGITTLRPSSKGSKDYRETGLVLDVNTALKIDFSMALGQVSEQVSVTATSVQVDTRSTQMGVAITAAARSIP